MGEFQGFLMGNKKIIRLSLTLPRLIKINVIWISLILLLSRKKLASLIPFVKWNN
jgi:hypothetical protein